MTPGARIQAAITLLDEIRAGTAAEQAITAWARRSRFAGSKDRAAIRDHVFQALRCLRSYGCLGGGETGRAVMLGALRAEGLDPDTLFTGEGYAPAPLSEAERHAGGVPVSPGARMNLPDWIVPEFTSSLGGEDKAAEAARILGQRAPVTVRVNLRKADVAQAVAQLAQDGIAARPTSLARAALVLGDGARKVGASAAYRDGIVELQDASSQAAMERLEIGAGARVLDFCAGGGGKTLALAARTDARWYAHDAHPQRMKDLPARASRAGVHVTLLDQVPVDDEFDLVLCDVPCSGSGTWRRTPDAKWRLTEADLNRLMAAQDDILNQAAGLVAPGGQLVFATCSVLICENEARIARFLAQTPGWAMFDQRRWPVTEDGDGFFLAQLKRDS